MSKKPNPIDAHVGARLRFRRMTIGMSQEKLGEELSLTFQQIQKYEKGANRIGASRLYEISRVLGVTVAYFFDELPDVDGVEPVNGQLRVSPLDFVASPEGLQLNVAFARIEDAPVRRRIVELVRTLAGDSA